MSNNRSTVRQHLHAHCCGLALVAVLSASSVQARCFEYGPKMVTLEGRLSMKVFYGPPNYGDNPNTDARKLQYVLSLDAPICVNGDLKSDATKEAVHNVTVIQIVASTPELRQALQLTLGHKTQISGTLLHAETAHDHTPVLLLLKHVGSTPSAMLSNNRWRGP